MDIRIEKTEKAIKNAFMELRSKKALEKITIKELCELACINKSTFYSHYEDIYALSEALEIETVNSIVSSIPKDREYSSDNPHEFTRELCLAFVSHISLINILFSVKEQNNLSNRLEFAIKQAIFSKYPEYKDNIEYNILLSYSIQGGYHAYINNQNADAETLVRVIENIVRTLKPLY
ncbi:MAG: TetR/AcrR family transcriptional regulator [Agathobacter sp.]|nr:TetR/AcrR family transcriptional regulator [Agathobacter sp.]